MASNENNDLLRLRQKHAPADNSGVSALDGRRILAAQSPRSAIVAALITITIFSIFWAAVSELVGRVWPWMTILLGVALGLSIRRAGKGIDWRFPLLAAILALFGALMANIFVSAVIQANEMDIGTFQVLRSVTILTWRDFFSEVMTPADLVFGLFAAAIAAFYASPKLSRQEFLALRLWQQEQEHD